MPTVSRRTMTGSTEWNYGPGWEHVLLDAYGVAPDDPYLPN
jgi:hypothetical protein